jgi:transposase-like protein
MNENQQVEARKRRSSEEVKRLVVEFKASGLRRNEFCRIHGMALSTLRRHLKNHGSGKAGVKAGCQLMAVELPRPGWDRNPGTACALEVVLSSGRRIEVRREFDSATLGRVVKVLEGL